MALPYYVSPEQFMKDKADYARKGIARGKSVIVLEYSDGVLFVAENPSSTLHKVSEIYDRLAFAAVGKFNEFEALRMHGIRQADIQGFSYSREDVTARSLANAYSQILGQGFTADLKPFEVEILVAQVGDGDKKNELYHILYDGSIADEESFVAMGGQSESLRDYLSSNYQPDTGLVEATVLGINALTEVEKRPIPPEDIEAATLDRTRDRRKFRRLSDSEVSGFLS